jgi:type I restriction enzyme, S subunit
MSASKWKPYPNYTESNFEFSPQYPSHWELKRMQWIGKFSASGIDKKSVDTESDCLMVNYTDVYGNETAEIHSNQELMKTTATVQKIAEHQLEVGDLLFTPSSETADDIGVSAVAVEDMPGTVYSYHLTRFRPSIPLGVDFSRFFCNSTPVLSQLSAVARGTTRQILSRDDFNTLKVAVPPAEERKKIGDYLSKKTKQITLSIQHLENNLSLLEQKRSSLILQAITKGLNLDAPMKDSGIDWIGEIPQHWDSKKVKFVSKMFRGKFGHRPRNDPKLYDGDYPFVQTGNVARANKYITEYTQTLNDLGRSVSEEFPAGTIVMAIAANIGDVAILTFDACFPDSIIGFNPNPDMNQEYVYYSLSALASELDKVASQSTQQNLNIELVGNLMIPTPPETEQIIIGKYISEIEQTSSHSKEKIETLISKLMEYRTALISAVVTGKIDVRESV